MATSLAQKLQLKPGQTLSIHNPPPTYLARLTAEMDTVTVTDQKLAAAPAVMLFVNSLEEAVHFVPGASATVAADGLFWIVYPKQSSGIKTDVNRDTLWQAVEKMGWRPVRQIAVDETWSAVRFRPVE